MTKLKRQLPIVVLFAAALAAVGGPAVTASATVRQAGQPHAAAPLVSGRPGLGLVPGPRIGLPAGLPGSRRVPKPGTSSVLNNLYCVTASDCWAVGSYTTAHQGTRNQVLHWTGKAWHTVAAPNPGGSQGASQSQLFGIRCTGAKNCWAVGYYTGKHGLLNQALRWNGSQWSLIATPQPGGTTSGSLSELFDVTCVSSSQCWAIGEYGRESPSEISSNEVLRWNGRSWSKVHAPQPAGTKSGDLNFLDAIRCSSGTRCLAIGSYGTAAPELRNEALRWNGRKWSLMKTPQPGGTSPGNVNVLDGLTCASATSCWSVGLDGSFGSPVTLVNEVLHWNGSKWLLASVPNPDGTGSGASNELFGDFCANSRDCWAVGEYGSISGGTGSILTQALHWNGTKWSRVKTPSPGGTADNANSVLFAVRCSRPDNCWAVGESAGPSRGLKNVLLHWNGRSWSVH